MAAMSQASDGFELRDSLIALPKRVLPMLALIPFLSTGLGIYLVATDNSESVRTAAILLSRSLLPLLPSRSD